MSITFRPAIRENVGLIIGVFGASGSGKTYSAMRVASGLSGGKPFAVIDTESRRALHYADAFRFDHGELHAPFRPDTYAEAIKLADGAGYPVIVVDSCSHEWAGEGGILDWQEEELDRMAGDDYRKREACKMAAWIKPKMSHKQMVQRLLQVKAHLILCFRAEEKSVVTSDYADAVRKIRVPNADKLSPDEIDREGQRIAASLTDSKKQRVKNIGWQPICEKNMPYELTMSFLLTPESPGIPQPVKLQQQHRPAVRLDKPLDEEAGKLLAGWAAGDEPKPPAPYDYACAIKQISEAVSEAQLKSIYAPAYKRAKADGDMDQIKQLEESKDKAKDRIAGVAQTDVDQAI